MPDLYPEKIKLIIWDLDNTFWAGTLTEGGCLPIDRNINFIKNLVRHGIVSSICSKNDFETCKELLSNDKFSNIWEYFVFPSINWTAKGERVKNIITTMGLRPTNVLFLDDENANLQAVKSLLPEISVSCMSDAVFSIIDDYLQTTHIDEKCSRLKQYKELENRENNRKEYESNDIFLKESCISVELIEDCIPERERICELINRTNQLNFTKIRLSQKQVDELLTNPKTKCGYVYCKDKWSDYGIVGFFALDRTSNVLQHFLFSCRTIGMGVEQYVYCQLGFPHLETKGQVISTVNCTDCPTWINSNSNNPLSKGKITKSDFVKTVLLKGPCDIQQVSPYFSRDKIKLVEEFSYVSSTKHVYIESNNHSTSILLSQILTNEEKKMFINTLPFIDDEYFNTSIFNGNNDVVILSLMPDYGLGIYVNKNNSKYTVVFGQYTVDYTQTKNWLEFLNRHHTPNTEALQSEYKFFQENYVLKGRLTNEEMIENLSKIREALPAETELILLNGSEFPYPGNVNSRYQDRHILHKALNEVVRQFSQQYKNVHIIDISSIVQGSDLYLDTITHFKKQVYYKIAIEIQNYLEHKDGIKLRAKTPIHLFFEKLYRFAKRVLRKFI